MRKSGDMIRGQVRILYLLFLCIELTIEAQNYIDLPRKWLNVSDKELNFNKLFVGTQQTV
jgi:hypothetical protein